MTLFILAALCSTNLCHDPGSRETSVAALSEAMNSTDFRTFRPAYDRLTEIARSSVALQAKEAQDVLSRFEKEAHAWLVARGTDKAELVRPFRQVMRHSHIRLNLSEETDVLCMRYLFSLNVVSLSITGKHFNDEHMKALSHMPDLRIIDMAETSVTGAGLVDMELPALEILRVGHCPITDKYLKSISFPNLAALDVMATQVGNKSLQNKNLFGLRSLHLSGTRVDAQGLKHLTQFKTLEYLRIDAHMLDEETIATLAKLPLRLLRVHYSRDEADRVRRLVIALPDSCVKELILRD